MRIIFADGHDPTILRVARALAARGDVEAQIVRHAPLGGGVHDERPEPWEVMCHVVPAQPAEGAYEFALKQLQAGRVDVMLAGSMMDKAELLPLIFRAYRGEARILLFGLAHVSSRRFRSFLFLDPVVNIEPSAETLAAIVRAAVPLVPQLLLQQPRVCFISHRTALDPPDARRSKQMEVIADLWPELSEELIDTPLQLDVALSDDAALYKCGVLGAPPNLLVFPDLTSANVFYKSLQLFGGPEDAELGGALLCSDHPLPIGILPRRATVAVVERALTLVQRATHARGKR